MGDFNGSLKGEYINTEQSLALRRQKNIIKIKKKSSDIKKKNIIQHAC